MSHICVYASKVELLVKNLPANAADIRVMGSSVKVSLKGNNPIQYSCLEYSMDKEHGWIIKVAKVSSTTVTTLSQTHTHIEREYYIKTSC